MLLMSDRNLECSTPHQAVDSKALQHVWWYGSELQTYYDFTGQLWTSVDCFQGETSALEALHMPSSRAELNHALIGQGCWQCLPHFDLGSYARTRLLKGTTIHPEQTLAPNS